MWSHARAPRPRTLAGQFLALQVVLLLLVVAVTSVVSFRQSDADFRDARGARLGRAPRTSPAPRPCRRHRATPGQRRALAFYAQQRQDDIGASAVYLTDPDGPDRGRPPTRPGSGDAGRPRARRRRRGARGAATSTTAASARSRPRSRSTARGEPTTAGDLGRRRGRHRALPVADRAAPADPARRARVPRRRPRPRAGRGLAARPPDQAPHPRPRAGRDRGPRRPARGAARPRSARASSRSTRPAP